jgi:hypothetical protein
MAELRDKLLAIAEDIRPATVRQNYYQAATVQHIVPADPEGRGYRTTQRNLVWLRENGLLDYGAIVDLTRFVRKPLSFASIGENLRLAAKTHRKDLWAERPFWAMVWVEKDAMVGVLEPVTRGYDVGLYSARGYSSVTFAKEAAEEIRSDGRPVHIFHLGDWDPSGYNAAEVIERELRKHAPGADIAFEKLAVTEEQRLGWGLSTVATKTKDARYPAFRRRCDELGISDASVELDAINPNRLRQTLREALALLMPDEELRRLKAVEAEERERVRELVDEIENRL